MHGFNWDKWTTGKPAERLALIPAGQEHILEQEDGKKRWVQVVTELSRAFALCAASDEATEIRDDVSFFQALQAALNKQSGTNRKTPEQIEAAIRQLVSKAITTEGEVIDVFTAAGLPKPDISILSDQFLTEVRGLKHKNVAAELLEKLLKELPAGPSGGSREDRASAGGVALRRMGGKLIRFAASGSARLLKDGARCRVRTCDPFRVKEVLYH
jgi:type I restriction enzyme R subunit